MQALASWQGRPRVFPKLQLGRVPAEIIAHALPRQSRPLPSGPYLFRRLISANHTAPFHCTPYRASPGPYQAAARQNTPYPDSAHLANVPGPTKPQMGSKWLTKNLP